MPFRPLPTLIDTSPPKAGVTGSNPVGCASLQTLKPRGIAAKPPAWQLCSSYISSLAHIPRPALNDTSTLPRVVCPHRKKHFLSFGKTGRLISG